MKRRSFAALCAVLIVVACSPDDFIEYQLPNVDDGASGGTKKSLQTDGSEEQHIVLKTGATLTVPKDAVDHSVTLTMERPADKEALQLVKSVHSLSAVSSAPYVLTPHGTKFREPVSIELPISKDTQKKLVVGWLENEDDTEWKKLGTPTVKDGVAKIEVDHFSVIILLEDDKSGFPADVGAQDGGVSSDAGNVATGDAGMTRSDPLDAAASADAGNAMTGPSVDAGSSDATAHGQEAAVSDASTTSADAAAQDPDSGTSATPDAGSSDAGAPSDAALGEGGTSADGGTTKDAGRNDAG